MSKLEIYLQDWRNTLAEDEALTTEDINELEDHLRADFLHLKEKGLSDQDAFWLAVKHLGNTDNICKEYRKVNGTSLWTRRAQWMIIGYLFLYLMGMSITMVSQLGATLTAFWASGWTSFVVYGLIKVLLLTGLVYVVYHLLSGTRSFQSAMQNIIIFTQTKTSSFIIITIAGITLLGTVSNFAGSILRARVLNPYQIGSYVYGENILSILLAILLPTLLISLFFKTQRKSEQRFG